MSAVLAASLAVAFGAQGRSIVHAAQGTAPASPATNNAKGPVRFELNQGQADPAVRFIAKGASPLFLTQSEAVMVVSQPVVEPKQQPGIHGPTGGTEAKKPHQSSAPDATKIKGAVVHLRPSGANPNPEVAGVDQLPGISNYLTGSDPAKWHVDVPSFARVSYRNLYPGVDLVFHGGTGGVEYDYVLAPGAHVDDVAMDVTGADHMSIDRGGDLVLATAGGQIRQHKPVIYQEDKGRRTPISGGYVSKGGNKIGFSIGDHDGSKPIVVDPVLSYSTYLGVGAGGTFANGDHPTANADLAGSVNAVAVDSAGSAYVTGQTNDDNFPTTTGAFQRTKPSPFSYSNAYVTKLAPDGSTLEYSTYLGGHTAEVYGHQDVGTAIGVDTAGHAFIAGWTNSLDFPTQNPIQATNNSTPGSPSAFISELSPTGSSLIYSTYLGGSTSCGYCGGTHATGIAVDSGGNAYIAGDTTDGDFPTTPGAFSRACNRTTNGPCGSNPQFGDGISVITSTTFRSPSAQFTPADVNMSISGTNIPADATISGVTNSTTVTLSAAATGTGSNLTFTLGRFPQTDAFVTKIQAGGAALKYSTFLGGTGSDGANGIAIDSSGSAYVAGTTQSADFPTMKPLQASYAGSGDVFVTKVIPDGSGLSYSTYLGGSGSEQGVAGSIALDPAGNAYVTGTTSSTNFPVKNPQQTVLAGGSDAFVVKLASGGASLVYATYLGGTGDEDPPGVGIIGALPRGAIAVNAQGEAFVTGETLSANFPSKNLIEAYDPGPCVFAPGYQPSCSNGFVAELNAQGSGLVYSTWFGAAGSQCNAIALGPGGAAFVAGSTTSSTFPTTSGSFESTPPPGWEGFVARIAPDTGGPLVTGLTPASGAPAGGTSVAITGRGFVGTTTVKFGTVPAVFAVNSDSSITASSPPGGAGVVHVTVTTNSGTSPPNPITRFRYPPAPAITGINPTSGTLKGGTQVTITGTDFSGATSVKFGGVPAAFTIVSDSSITTSSPARSLGAAAVTVATPSGPSQPGPASEFTYVPQSSITEFAPAASPTQITQGPDGNVWFANCGSSSDAGSIGRITPAGVITTFTAGVTAGSCPSGIAAGADGNLWFAENSRSAVGRITRSGIVTEFTEGISAGAAPNLMTAGPDGNLWFSEQGTGAIARVTTSGVVTEFSAGITPGSNPYFIRSGPDGALWFTEYQTDKIGRITTAGVVTEYGAGITSGSNPVGIAAGPDGNLWFTEYSGARIGRITTVGVVTEFSSGISSGSLPTDITVGPDGNLWFTEHGTDRVAKITTSGVVTEFSDGISPGAAPYGIISGSGRTLWFTESAGNRIGRVIVLAAPGDFDGDHKTDLTVYRPSTGTWYTSNSGGSPYSQLPWGRPADVTVPADYDGTGTSQVAIYRPSTGEWFVRHADGSYTVTTWGSPGSADIPVPADYEGAGKADLAIYRPSTGQWFVLKQDGSYTATAWGAPGGSDIPVPANYDGSGNAQIAVYRPGTGQWYVLHADGSYTLTTWGQPGNGDIPVPSDYQGVGKADLAVYRRSTGEWFVLQQDGSYTATVWGAPGSNDIPQVGDFNGDGKTDLTVYRPGSSGTWYVLPSGGGPYTSTVWGTTGDVPVTLAVAIQKVFFP